MFTYTHGPGLAPKVGLQVSTRDVDLAGLLGSPPFVLGPFELYVILPGRLSVEACGYLLRLL